MSETTISISTELKEQLDSLKTKGRSYDALLEYLLFEYSILTPRLKKKCKEALKKMDKGEWATFEEIEENIKKQELTDQS